MKLKHIIFGAMVAIGCGVGANANAVNTSLSICCRVLQDECIESNPHPVVCANVYNSGGGQLFVELGDVAADEMPFVPDQVDWLSVDQALNELQVLDPECARVVELRIFSGMSTDEIAEACQTSVATVGRRWRFARSWLAERLETPLDPRGD